MIGTSLYDWPLQLHLLMLLLPGMHCDKAAKLATLKRALYLIMCAMNGNCSSKLCSACTLTRQRSIGVFCKATFSS